MEIVKLKHLILALLFASVAVFPQIVRADIPNPDFSDANCPKGQQLVVCDNGFRFYPINTVKIFPNKCVYYENNPEYRQLVVKEKTKDSVNPPIISSDKGQEKFCFKPNSLLSKLAMHSMRYLLLFTLTTLFELPIFFIFGFRSLASLLKVVLANAISILGLYLGMLFFPYTTSFTVIVFEVLVVLFEVVFLVKIVKDVGSKKIVIGTIIANLISATVGSLAIRLLLYNPITVIGSGRLF